ncbi:hypothetical protein K488DRAFT_82804 [Vararia minispora EC-137]|uniref:Uncharacterized protein n=1 Tax=Vararia minispora EC-137 TaxID=1314806 RepID=A0ACB8QV85_9AGAM|nr:hypothetical protein K488DRAFT_82804 [Vararia minispora EC-137]
MEVHDAQMLDYPSDLDVHMRTTFSSPKPWLYAEATMEDDSEPFSVDTHSVSYSHQEDVEVEMEQVYEETAEYDMLDDDRSHPPPLLDVDFVDLHHEDDSALRPQPPSVLDAVLSDHIPQAAQSSHMSYFSSEQEHEGHDLTEQEHAGYSQEHAEEYPRNGDGHAQPDEAPSCITIEHDHAEHTDSNVEPNVTNVLDGSFADYAEESQPEPYDAPAEGSYDAGDEPLSPRPAEEAYDASAVPELEDGSAYSEQFGPADESGHDPDDPQVSSVNVGQSEQVYDATGGEQGYDDTGGIDPVPAVFIDVPSSSEQPKTYLFNLPVTQEGSASECDPGASVLLGHDPRCYYLPLPELFSALREEERIQRIPELQHGELSIDAYDLGLVISEASSWESFHADESNVLSQDNKHAGNVNLHELNDLHDKLGMEGPLRVRLHCNPSRFIICYERMRQQVGGLTLVEALDHQEEHQPGEAQRGDDHGLYQHADGFPTELNISDRQTKQDPTAGHDEASAAVSPERGGERHSRAGQDADDEGPEQVQTTDPDNTADTRAHEEEALVLDAGGNDAYADPVDEPTDVQDDLDADSIHGTADTDASAVLPVETAEYTEVGDEWEEHRSQEYDEPVPAGEAEESLDDEATLSSNGEADDAAGADADRGAAADVHVDGLGDAIADKVADADGVASADGIADTEYGGSVHDEAEAASDEAPTSLISAHEHTAADDPDAESDDTGQADAQVGAVSQPVLAHVDMSGASFPIEDGASEDGNYDDSWDDGTDDTADWDEAADDADESVTVASRASPLKRRYDDLEDADDEPSSVPDLERHSPSPGKPISFTWSNSWLMWVADTKRTRTV